LITSYQDLDLFPNTNYSYTVSAYDAAGNISGQSVPVSATTPQGSMSAPPGISPPTIPSFQVSNSPTWIEITWQNLPASTTLIVFSRADNPGGPWNIFYSESDPETAGPFTVQIIIDTPNVPFYYQLTAFENTAIIGTYGPVYLSALQE